MNNYPSWWNTTITLYNKFEKPDGEIKWFKHHIEGCFYKQTMEKLTIGDTTIAANQSVCRLRVSDSFADPIAWKAMEDSGKATYYTLKSGDIIVAGEVDFDVNEYQKGSRSSDLKDTYTDWPGCFTVEHAAINVGGGRGNEHYLARGM